MDGTSPRLEFPQGFAGILQIDLPHIGWADGPSGAIQQLHLQQIL